MLCSTSSAPMAASVERLCSARLSPLASAGRHSQRPARICSAARASAAREDAAAAAEPKEEGALAPMTFSRRALALRTLQLGVALASAPALLPHEARAVQGLTAGRIPGLSPEPDSEGFYTYSRPEGKSGGHGVGWSEIPAYKFKVPATWEERPVSIADLGGTEIDLRFTSRDQGELAVVVAPVLRFADVGFNASVTIEELGTPEKIIRGFAPELFGNPLEEDDILETRVLNKPGSSITYYQWHVKPYRLVSATAYGNRIFILSVVSNARQWRKFEPQLRSIAGSFVVPTA